MHQGFRRTIDHYQLFHTSTSVSLGPKDVDALSSVHNQLDYYRPFNTATLASTIKDSLCTSKLSHANGLLPTFPHGDLHAPLFPKSCLCDSEFSQPSSLLPTSLHGDKALVAKGKVYAHRRFRKRFPWYSPLTLRHMTLLPENYPCVLRISQVTHT